MSLGLRYRFPLDVRELPAGLRRASIAADGNASKGWKV
jgi:hypothetical protein